MFFEHIFVQDFPFIKLKIKKIEKNKVNIISQVETSGKKK